MTAALAASAAKAALKASDAPVAASEKPDKPEDSAASANDADDVEEDDNDDDAYGLSFEERCHFIMHLLHESITANASFFKPFEPAKCLVSPDGGSGCGIED